MMDRKSSTSLFWALLVTLLACLPPILIDLGKGLTIRPTEQTALASSQETWLRTREGQAASAWVAFNDGQPSIDKPPLVAWMNMLAWTGLDPATATPVQLTYRARLMSVVMGLIAIASIFWMGNTLVDRRMAVLIALVAGSMFLLQQQARVATYDIHALAWTCLSIAGGLWAMAPGHATRARHKGFGWVICGTAMACAAMSNNPLAFATIVIPLIVAIAMVPQRRIINLGGLITAVLIGAAPVAAWYWQVDQAYGDVRQVLTQEVLNPSTPESVFYYVSILGLVLPWTLWMVCGLVHP
ncbi:MAG: hypothetical protein L0219_02990, partial [Phycisphaerales bacterium]|nr:hypothetical protein [Phycisphaerales bacterium]